MNTLKEIAKASFFAGIIFLSVAFLLAPKLWWLAACASFPAGYFAFRFDIVRKNFPAARKQANEMLSVATSSLIEVFEELAVVFLNWLTSTHPVLFSAFVLIVTGTTILCVSDPENTKTITEKPIDCLFLMSIMFVFLALLLGLLSLFGEIWTQSSYDSKDKKALNPPPPGFKNTKKLPLTYRNGFMWMGMGVVAIIAFFGFYLWKYIGLTILTLVKVIYKSERVVAGFSGTLGGSVTFLLFKTFSTGTPSPTEYTLAVFFGGVISAAIGAASWKVVSERLLSEEIPS